MQENQQKSFIFSLISISTQSVKDPFTVFSVLGWTIYLIFALSILSICPFHDFSLLLSLERHDYFAGPFRMFSRCNPGPFPEANNFVTLSTLSCSFFVVRFLRLLRLSHLTYSLTASYKVSTKYQNLINLNNLNSLTSFFLSFLRLPVVLRVW